MKLFGERTTSTYDAARKEVKQRFANGTWTSHTYDAANNETLVTTRRANNSLVSSFAYQYNFNNQRTQVVNHEGDVTTYVYDATSQLVAERHTEGV